MFSSESSPYRTTSPRSFQNSQLSYPLGSINDEYSINSPIFLKKTGGFPTPDLPPSMFKSPQASIIRSPSYGIASHHMPLNEKERFVLETPKAGKKEVERILEGKPITPPSEPLNTLSYVFPILIFVSFLLLFFIPQFAFIFCFSIIGYGINSFLIKKENKKRMNQVPKLSFSTPRR